MSQPTAYDPRSVEHDLYRRWESSGFFNPDTLLGKRAKAFSIAMPPPNVTGDLHIGHALTIALEDLMIRHARMNGQAALWVPGTDHAGIATQIKVERMLEETGTSRHEIGREVFLKHVWQWKERYGDTITKQIRAMGASCDWSRERFTMDEGLTEAVQAAFVKLYDDGLIYRAKRLINWCPNDQTALSDLEVRHEERAGSLWYINYRVKKSSHSITVATTRPETLLGDTAVAVNPKDTRYKALVGKRVIVPIVDREVPIVADARVEMDFGTGAVKVTPAHDLLDAEIAKTHGLHAIRVIGPDGTMTEKAGRDLAGLPVHEARVLIVEALDRDGLLEKTEDYRSNVAVCDRCSTHIEPQESDQWFVNMAPLAKPASAAVRSGKIRIVPKRFEKVYFHWLENIQDWCVSRQLWWGHRIPVWYCGGPKVKRMGFSASVAPRLKHGKVTTWRIRDHHFNVGDTVTFIHSGTGKFTGQGTITDIDRTAVRQLPLTDPTHHQGRWTLAHAIRRIQSHYPDRKVTPDTEAWVYRYRYTAPRTARNGCGEVIVSHTQPTRCPTCSGKTFVQDEDVLDTWFSSGLWTFSTLGWPNNQKGRVKRGDLKRFHPTSVMETGWDILFFWVARMVMLSLYFTGEVPFRTVYLNGLILDDEGKKMSKSKGTGIDPLVMTEKYGTDAMRLALVIGQSAGQDFKMNEQKIAGMRNFVNKLWNIGNYVTGIGNGESGIAERSRSTTHHPPPTTPTDRWILSRLSAVTEEATDAIQRFDFSAAGQRLLDFAWHEFADWYLEIHKAERNDALLREVFDVLLRLLHPFAPFVTEQLWQQLRARRKNEFLMLAAWPQPGRRSTVDEKRFAEFRATVAALRNFRMHSGHKPHEIGHVVPGNHTRAWLTLYERLGHVSLQGTAREGSRIGLGYASFHFPAARVKAYESWKKKERLGLTQYLKRLDAQLKNTKLPDHVRKQVEAKRDDVLRRQKEL
ncbi:MAG: valine--tRNA ligase [Candidatus Kerfeldbacteria bacterium]|nr:valine--tRNA ligase [Candidatus Kerfeldbacteria bacterium]